MMEEMRKAGQLHSGGERRHGVSKTPSVNLASQGIDKNLADRARKMAQLSGSEFGDLDAC